MREAERAAAVTEKFATPDKLMLYLAIEYRWGLAAWVTMLGESQRVITQSDGNLPPQNSRAMGFGKRTIQIYDVMKHENCPLCRRDATAAISTAELLRGAWSSLGWASYGNLKRKKQETETSERRFGEKEKRATGWVWLTVIFMNLFLILLGKEWWGW